MNVSLYQAAAAMNASARWQEMISENLGSSSVPGGRKREMAFSAIEAGLNGVTQNRSVIPAAREGINFQPGSMYPTGEPLNFAIEGKGFFEIQLPNGDHAYTRNGQFRLNPQGELISSQGYPISSESGKLQFDLNNHDPIMVSPAGEVSQSGEVKGKLRLVEFTDPQKLTRINDGFFLADNPNLHISEESDSKVFQGFMEGSNSSPTTEMAGLITAMRMFESNQRVLQMQDERMGRSISELTGGN